MSFRCESHSGTGRKCIHSRPDLSRCPSFESDTSFASTRRTRRSIDPGAGMACRRLDVEILELELDLRSVSQPVVV